MSINASSHPSALTEGNPERLFAELAQGRTTLKQLRQLQSPALSPTQKLFGLPAYHWLLLAQIFVIFPHAFYLPPWLFVLAAVSILAQLPSIKSRPVAKPRLYQLAQLTVFLGGIGGLFLTFGLGFGVEMGVTFLLLCLMSKLWELHTRRDAYVVLNLSLFVLAALFLLDQGLTTTLLVLLGASGVIFSFIALNDDGNLTGEGRLRSFAMLAGLALPLMIVLFLFFPRLPPLWSLELSTPQATTGVSDSMSPGDFANLSQSTELAFRAEFAGEMPPQYELYWRGLVFSDFDGITWTQNPNLEIWRGEQTPDWLETAWKSVPKAQQDNPLSYKIRLEPTNNTWLYGLDYPFTQKPGVRLTSAFTLRQRDPINQATSYEALRFSPMIIDSELTPIDRQINTALPASGNEQSRQFARELFAQSDEDPLRYVQAIQNWVNTEPFRYTLSPPPLGDNRIDEFLFSTRAGFCEHYASSFTVLMRSVGIPARVVAGYQGGERGRDGSSWEVRQMDAHAWTEIWLDGQGWVRVDPTSFVAPERVEEGMNFVTGQRGAAMFGSGATAQLSYQQFKMLQQLRRLSDQASYYWQRDIVGYDQDKQANSLLKWFNIKSAMQQVLWMAIVFVSLMAGIILWIWYRRRKVWHIADKPLVALSKRLAKHNVQLAMHRDEGVLSWLERLNAYYATRPDTSKTPKQDPEHSIDDIKRLYRRLRYGKYSTLDPKSEAYQDAIRQLYTAIKQLK